MANSSILHSNLYNGNLSADAVTYLLEKKVDISKNNIHVIFNKTFTREESYMYNILLDKLELSIIDAIKYINEARDYFIDYEISRSMYIKFDRYVNNINNNILNDLIKKPDYNLCLFTDRMLPFYNIESKEWKKAGFDANKEDYPDEIIGDFKMNNSDKDYKDELKLITKNNNFLEVSKLDISEYPDINKYINILEFLINNKLNNQAIIMVCRLMLSYKDCHIIKNKYIWTVLNNVENLKRYCLYYSMYLLRHEETIMFNNISSTDRIIFTLEEAHNMPNYSTIDLDINPYVTQLTDNTHINKTIPFYLCGKRYINNKEEFNKRFKLVTGDIFKGINLRELNASITGSILIPCVLKSPLEHDFDCVQWNRGRENIKLSNYYMIDIHSEQDEAFVNYAEYYYPSYVSLTDADFINEVLLKADSAVENNTSGKINDPGSLQHRSENEAIQYENEAIQYENEAIQYENEAIQYENEAIQYENESTDKATDDNKSTDKATYENESNDKDTDKTTDKTTTDNNIEFDINKVLNNRENKSAVNVNYNKIADIDISITTRDINDFKNKVCILFNKIKENAKHRGDVYINEIITIASIKYKIYGPGIPRPIDVFRIPYEPIKMIKKFHINGVKMYYDGELYLLRSCVSTLISGINENYKWFSCNKSPVDVLLKYAQRGISTILNSKERQSIINYVTINERWRKVFNNIKSTPEKMFCSVTERHAFFRPGLFNSGIRLGLRDFERYRDGIHNNTLSTQYNVFNISDKQIITHTNKKIYPPEYGLINEVVNSMNTSYNTF